MLLRQMKYFVAVAECGSFTKAAENCYISQSAISQQVQALENELGVKLIERRNRSLALTAAGEYLLKRARILLADANEICRETVRIANGGAAELKIGYLNNYSGTELNLAMARFCGRYPEISISIVSSTHEGLYAMLKTGRIDLAISDQRRAFSDDYVNIVLAKCGLFAEISANNSLSCRDFLELSDLKSIPCILISSAEHQRAEQDYYENTLGFSGEFLFAENLEQARLLVAGSRGFLPIENAGTLPACGESVKRLPVFSGENRIMRNYCIFWQKSRGGYYVEEFANILRDLLSGKGE